MNNTMSPHPAPGLTSTVVRASGVGDEKAWHHGMHLEKVASQHADMLLSTEGIRTPAWKAECTRVLDKHLAPMGSDAPVIPENMKARVFETALFIAAQDPDRTEAQRAEAARFLSEGTGNPSLTKNQIDIAYKATQAATNKWLGF